MAVMLLEWVATSTFLLLVVLALRAALGKRVSAGLRYAMWAVVLVRLLVPVQLFASPVAGTWVVAEKRTEQIVDGVGKFYHPDEGEVLNSLGGQDGPAAALTTFPGAPEPPALPDAPEPPAAPDLTRAPAWLGWVWLAGAAAAALVLLLSNLRFYWRLRQVRIPLDGADHPLRAYEAVGLPSPCLFGIVRPAVYVTPEAAADPDMLRHVLAHEYTHYQHGDHIWSLLRCAALAAHWWNPLVWTAAVLSQRDGELACDEGALKRLGDGERAGYGNTLLALVTAKPRPGDLFRCATTMAGDKKSLKERISRIACAPKRWMWAAAVAVLVTALACVCAFGTAEPADDGPAPDPAPSSGPAESLPPADEEAFNLSFSMNDSSDVVITGRAYGMELPRGAYWRPAADSLHPISYLTMVYPGFTGGIEGHVDAVWGNDEHTSVVMNTGMMAMLSSYYPSGYWSFTVDLSGEQAVVTEMTAQVPDNRTEPMGEPHMYPETITDQQAVTAARIAAKLMTAAEDYYRNNAQDYWKSLWEEHRALMFRNPDLNRDGVPEVIATSSVDEGAGMLVGVWQGETAEAVGEDFWDKAVLLWYDEGFNAHAGYNAIFLCTLDGEDYLLRYNPYMGQGCGAYSYQLFTLEGGVERVVRENAVEFDINFGTPMHESYDPEAIAAFMDEINGLLANSIQLMNTDYDLRGTFEAEGRLYDSLSWLNSWEPTFTRERDASLLDSLRAFQAAMEAEWYAEEPTLFAMNEEPRPGQLATLRYKDKVVTFENDWDWKYQPPEGVQPAVVDLNGDGKDEIVFSLIWGHGTGALAEHLYVFDADTLGQYETSTSGLEEMVLGQIQSTGDEENFYLRGLGMDVAIPKSEAGGSGAPVAEALGLGSIVTYQVKDSQVVCSLGCDASGFDMDYIGSVRVPLRMDYTGAFSCGEAEYLPGELD